ncbi:hypothetical protein CRS_07430 [Chryseobacterium sp. ON_d1]|nr:hypothetical protein CRS_07430 [Chryseobacterium sp. ON_d1]
MYQKLTHNDKTVAGSVSLHPDHQFIFLKITETVRLSDISTTLFKIILNKVKTIFTETIIYKGFITKN